MQSGQEVARSLKQLRKDSACDQMAGFGVNAILLFFPILRRLPEKRDSRAEKVGGLRLGESGTDAYCGLRKAGAMRSSPPYLFARIYILFLSTRFSASYLFVHVSVCWATPLEPAASII